MLKCAPTCQSIVLVPLLPLVLIVHREKKRVSSALTACTDSDFGTGPVLLSGKCCTGCQEWVNPAGWSETLNIAFCTFVHAVLRSGKKRKPNCHPAGCSGRMPPTACCAVGRCHIA